MIEEGVLQLVRHCIGVLNGACNPLATTLEVSMDEWRDVEGERAEQMERRVGWCAHIGRWISNRET
jgi:hypothetical protein